MLKFNYRLQSGRLAGVRCAMVRVLVPITEEELTYAVLDVLQDEHEDVYYLGITRSRGYEYDPDLPPDELEQVRETVSAITKAAIEERVRKNARNHGALCVATMDGHADVHPQVHEIAYARAREAWPEVSN